MQSCGECLKCRTADCTNIDSMDTPIYCSAFQGYLCSYGFSTKGISISLEPRLSVLDLVLQLFKDARQIPEQKDWIRGYISIALYLYVLLFTISNLSKRQTENTTYRHQKTKSSLSYMLGAKYNLVDEYLTKYVVMSYENLKYCDRSQHTELPVWQANYFLLEHAMLFKIFFSVKYFVFQFPNRSHKKDLRSIATCTCK